MAATYTDTLLTDRDKIRFWIRDTDTTDARYTDNEIAALLTMNVDWESAAIDLLHRDETDAALEAGMLKLGQFGTDQKSVRAAISEVIQDLMRHRANKYSAVTDTDPVFVMPDENDTSIATMDPW